MIDTVEIRLHDLTIHSKIEQYLFGDGNIGKTRIMRVSSLEGNTLTETAFRREIVQSKQFDYEYTIKHWSDLKIQSSHYDVKYYIDHAKDLIHFNVSIPKYLYGSNIAQFVKSIGNKNFVFGFDKMMESQSDMLYERLLKFVRHFFASFIGELKVDYRHVEIRRVDICYNQIFETKKHALDYLELQKNIVKSRVRNSSNYFRTYDTAVGYRTGSYYFKIYHKGSEYETKGDLKHHNKINLEYLKKQGYKYQLDKDTLKRAKKENYKILIDTKFYKDFADRILRYEISFTTDRMSELFNHKIYRKNSKEWKIRKEWYDHLHNKYKKDSGFLSFDHEDKKLYKEFKAVLQKRRNFYPWPHAEVILDSEKDSNDLEVITKAHFSKNLLKLMVKEFIALFKQYQIKTMPEKQQTINNLVKYNEEVKFWNDKEKEEAMIWRRTPKLKHEMNLSRITMLLKMLEHETLDEIKKQKIFSKATLYRYISDLKKLEVERQHNSHYIDMVTSTDFEEYYNICFTNPLKMYINKDSYFYF